MPTEYKFDDLDLREEPTGAKPDDTDATVIRSICQNCCYDTTSC
jgi:hypothetical protein